MPTNCAGRVVDVGIIVKRGGIWRYWGFESYKDNADEMVAMLRENPNNEEVVALEGTTVLKAAAEARRRNKG